jgi:hypothetical protein
MKPLFFFCILFQLSIYGHKPHSYVSNSLFVKLKPQFNRVNSSSVEKFNISQLQQLNRQHSLVYTLTMFLILEK